MNKDILNKIKEKREFSELPDIDIQLAYEQFEKRQVNEEEKIKLTRELLRKLFSAFVSKKLLSPKEKEPEWILRKHISTKERLPYYQEIYKKVLKNYKSASIIDLGAGINGFSYCFFEKIKVKINYTAIESVGQLIEFMKFYFKKNKINGNAIHLSLFEKDKVLDIIKKEKFPRIVFMFKVIDALESLKPNYSKELLLEIVPLADKVVLSFATKSLGNRQTFKVKRNWVLDFIQENFKMLDEFEVGGEKYIVFSKRNV